MLGSIYAVAFTIWLFFCSLEDA